MKQIMKRAAILAAVAALALALAACGGDPEQYAADLAQAQQAAATGEHDPALTGRWSLQSEGVTVAYTFNADGTGSLFSDDGTYDYPFTYYVMGGDQLHMDAQFESNYEIQHVVCTYQVEGDSLTLTDTETGDVSVLVTEK